MLRLVWIFLLLQTALFSLEIDNRTSFNELLSHSEIYKDSTRTESISTIQKRPFKPNNKLILGEGYAPKYDVWIRFRLTNNTSNRIEKIVEYGNPLTSYIEFYEESRLKKREGLLNVSKDRESLNPNFKIILKPHQSKEFYIKTSSKITPLIIKLNLWNPKSFQDKELINKSVLIIFFGILAILILYTLLTLLVTKELNHLYFFLFFSTVIFHHIMYKGIATLFLSSETMRLFINFSSCIVALPIIFLTLFTREVLELKQYHPRLYRVLNWLLILYPLIIVTIFVTEEYQYRSLFSAIILTVLLIVSSYTLLKKNQKDYFIFAILILIALSGLLIYLSSLGIYNIFRKYPYYEEVVWGLVIILFPLRVLVTKIRALKEEKRHRETNEVLFKESEHRAINNMQMVLNFLSLQKENTEEKKTKEILTNLENRIMATTEVSSLLHQDMNETNINEYLSLMIEKIEESFTEKQIDIELHNNITTINLEELKYCRLIINEAVTNSFKHAFKHSKSGKIEIFLNEEKEHYHLIIRDNGSGFEDKAKKNKVEGGLYLIELLTTLQLGGHLNIEKDNGVEIKIVWRRDEK